MNKEYYGAIGIIFSIVVIVVEIVCMFYVIRLCSFIGNLLAIVLISRIHEHFNTIERLAKTLQRATAVKSSKMNDKAEEKHLETKVKMGFDMRG